jgi:hypothetical protein
VVHGSELINYGNNYIWAFSPATQTFSTAFALFGHSSRYELATQHMDRNVVPYLGSSSPSAEEKIEQPPTDTTVQNVAEMSIDDLPDGVIAAILEKVAASARSPADFLSATLT